MTIDDAIADLAQLVKAAAPDAAIRSTRTADESATIKVYAAAELEDAIKAATTDEVLQLLISEGLDVQILVYDIAVQSPS